APRLAPPEQGPAITTPSAEPTLIVGSPAESRFASSESAVKPAVRSTREVAAALPAVIALPATPAPTAIPAVPPTLGPSLPVAKQPAADTPVEAVRTFYQLVEHKQFQTAEQLWTQHMLGVFPPSENIIQRFAQTQQLTVEDAQLLALDEAAGRATVN